MTLRFGDCALDPDARELKREGRRVELSPKALELLLALVEARPRALSAAQLRDRLWPDTFVSEASLRQVVMELRRALGDAPEAGRLIRTVRRFGYAFGAEASEQAPVGAPPRTPARCALLRGRYELGLYAGENLLGREPDADVRLTSEQASRRHARIVVDDGRALLEDLQSKNGTRLNGRRVSGAVALQPGDRIEIGSELLVFCGPGTNTTRSEAGDDRQTPNEEAT